MNTRVDVCEFFAYSHLPQHLQAVSKPFFELATTIYDNLPECEERTLTLRKLWEAKNYAVWIAATAYKEPQS